ncbi:hypothetical protein [Methanolobus sp.]|uniref:hypothetical protein n=1 Tax=Methanolobus sp. TaxID=1874737 RepID=UPI0025D324CD|nr:hypothetical protein [Methanolobus sp.]
MTEKSTITEKQILVLTHLIKKEGELILTNQDEEKHYYTYPGKIERELNGRVSRVHAKEICDKFVELAILKIDTKPDSNNKNYFISPGLETFRKILCLLVQNLDTKTSVEVLGSNYFQSKINMALVITVLRERNVTFRRKLDILRWEEAEARKLFENKKLPDSDINSLEAYAQRKVEIIDSEDTNFQNHFYPVDLEIAFPVMDISSENKVLFISEIQSQNVELFSVYPDLISCTSAILEHYKKWQMDNVIMPVLLFIKTSPTALVEFLCKSWNFEKNYLCDNTLTGAFERVIEKLMFLALSDITLSGSYPKNSLVNEVSISVPVKKLDGKEQDELMSFEIYKNQIFYFNSSFRISSSSNNEVNRRSFATIVDKGKTYSRDVITKLSGFIDDIKDYSLIIEYLKRGDKPVAKVISTNFSAYLNNLILYCDPTKNIPLKVTEELKNGLRELLLNEDWSKLQFIGYHELSKKSIDKLNAHLYSIDRCPDALLRIDRIATGVSILGDVFGEEKSCVPGMQNSTR